MYVTVATGAGQKLDVTAVDARMHAVAVVFDLVQPAVACLRLVYKARELRLDPFGRLRCYLLLGLGTFDLPLKVLKEVGPALGMFPFNEAALVFGMIENALHPISIEANNSVNRA